MRVKFKLVGANFVKLKIVLHPEPHDQMLFQVLRNSKYLIFSLNLKKLNVYFG